jgi:carbamoyl-phosphate synthase large subunit
MNIFVSGASGIVGYGIVRSLIKNDKIKVYGGTIYDSSPANLFCHKVIVLPKTTASNYIDSLISVIKEFKIDILIPSIEIDMQVWNERRSELESTNAIVALNSFDLIKICEDKYLFYKLVRSSFPEITIPTETLTEMSEYTFPCIIKPRKGFGSKGIKKFKSKTEMQSHLKEIPENYIIQPIIGNDDEEYTVGAFFDKSSNLIDYVVFKRKLSSEGFTNEAVVCDFDFNLTLVKLASFLHPVGSTNFQFRIENSIPYLLEINPRISSSTNMRTLIGYNEALKMVDLFYHNVIPKKSDVSSFFNKKLMRYTEEKII